MIVKYSNQFSLEFKVGIFGINNSIDFPNLYEHILDKYLIKIMANFNLIRI